MEHPIYRVVRFRLTGLSAVQVWFDDGLQRLIDFTPVLAGELYGPLRDPEFFSQVKLDPEVHTLVWPNGADFDPATLHDWPDCVESLRERAQQWRETAA